MFKFRSGGYTLQHFQRDLTAGVIVGLVALPLAMAFAIASGVDPEAGLYTAIVAGILISLLGVPAFRSAGRRGLSFPSCSASSPYTASKICLWQDFWRDVFLVLMGVLQTGHPDRLCPPAGRDRLYRRDCRDYFYRADRQFLGMTGVESHPRFLDNMAELVGNLPR